MTSYIKNRPTVLDQLPLDVIRTFIFPCLNYEERIQLNQCLPKWDRISKKIDILSIKKHEQTVLVLTIRNLINKQEVSSGTEQIKNTTNLIKFLLSPRGFTIIQDNSNIRQAVLDKIIEFVQTMIEVRDIELGLRLKLASKLKKLRDKINESGPYTDCKYTTIPDLSFT